MRVALFGGTFDPVHLGHLRAAESAREALGLDLVAFLPCAVPPHRNVSSTIEDRLAMTQLATESNPGFATWDTERRRVGPSYTVDTVDTLLRERPLDSFVLLVGTDTFAEMTSWREPERLFALVEVAVADRPGWDAGELQPPFAGCRAVRRIGGPSLPVSASAVRARVRQGLSVRYLVPDTVAEYIAKRGLYR